MNLRDFTEAEEQLLEKFSKNPQNKECSEAVNSFYWGVVLDLVYQALSEARSGHISFAGAVEVMNFGLLRPSLVDRAGPGVPLLKEALQSKNDFPNIYYLDQWLENTYADILGRHKLDRLKDIIIDLREKKRDAEIEIKRLQMGRRKLFENGVMLTQRQQGNTDQLALVQSLAQFEIFTEKDTVELEKALQNREISDGRFLNVEDRRHFMALEANFLKKERLANAALNIIRDDTARKGIQKVNLAIHQNIEQIVEFEGKIAHLIHDIEQLVEKINQISEEEVAEKMILETKRLRELTKLTATRIHKNPQSVLNGTPFIINHLQVVQMLAQVEEFDPGLYNNQRCGVMGKPRILLVPGFGNGTYELDTHSLIIPIMSHMEVKDSILKAVIDYRLGVDEDRSMIKSFGDIKEYRRIDNMMQLREKFSRDYYTWLDSEYNGFKTLSHGIRIWFEEHIGPDKNKVLTPNHLSLSAGNVKKLNRLEKELKEKIAELGSSSQTWYEMGVIHAQKEENTAAWKCFYQSISKDQHNWNALYNLAFVEQKLGRLKDASKHFEFYSKNAPKSWKANLAREFFQEVQQRLAPPKET